MGHRIVAAMVLSRAGASHRDICKFCGNISWAGARGAKVSCNAQDTLVQHSNIITDILSGEKLFYNWLSPEPHCYKHGALSLHDLKIHRIFRNAATVYLAGFGSLLRPYWHFENHATSKYFLMLNVCVLIRLFYFKPFSFYFCFVTAEVLFAAIRVS